MAHFRIMIIIIIVELLCVHHFNVEAGKDGANFNYFIDFCICLDLGFNHCA